MKSPKEFGTPPTDQKMEEQTAAMATSEPDPHQIDRLSALPDAVLVTVLSLLPIRVAARTSVLSRLFRHLWRASPSVDLSNDHPTFFEKSTYVSMVYNVLRRRTPSNPLLRLHLHVGHPFFVHHGRPCDITESFITSLLVHAHALGLRHLTINGHCYSELVLRSVLSISSLESLSIYITRRMNFPSAIALTRLKNLSINLDSYNATQIERLISELCCLEELHLSMSSGVVCLSSQTIKKLELLLVGNNPQEHASLGLFMPSLKFFSLKNHGTFQNTPSIHGEIPFIKKAVVTLSDLYQKDVTAVAQFLNCISHVEELSLDLEEHMFAHYPFPVLMEPGKEVPTFPNLKHLEMNICCHEYNFEAMVTMLHHSTALESLKLYHKTKYMMWVKRGKRNAWRSKLPRNSDSNPQYAWLNNLHLGENKREFMKLINKKCTPKKRRVGS